MKNWKTYWAIPVAGFILLSMSFPSFGQAGRPEQGSGPVLPEHSEEASPYEGREELVPHESGGGGPIEPSPGGPPGMPHGGDEPIPPPPFIPIETMADSCQDIYIYIKLLLGEGPPPPENIVITDEYCVPDSEYVEFKCDVFPIYYGGDYYRAYRDTVALFSMLQLGNDTTSGWYNMLPENTTTRYYYDNFVDTLWWHYFDSSKGVCDTMANMFYVFTTIDTGADVPGGIRESSYPSWCLCEYDQPMWTSATFGTKNVVSFPCVHDSLKVCSDLSDIAVNQVDEWDPEIQAWVSIGVDLGFMWFPNESLNVSHIYQIWGKVGVTPNLFSTYTPGIIPSTDTTYTLKYSATYGGKNIIMLPFYATYIDEIHNCQDLAENIEEAGSGCNANVTQIERWEPKTQVWISVGVDLGFMWFPNEHVRAGMPYRIWLTSTCNFDWPVP